MKLKNIELQNIGLYKKQTINLFSRSKSVYMIWGNNGAGKTTLLNSIKVGLLGDKAFGSDFNEYCLFVKEKLISLRTADDKKKASIKICLEIKEQNDLFDYVVERIFQLKEEVLEETLKIWRNGVEIDYLEKEQFINKIATVLPPSLLDVIIFDGENAINILDKDEMYKLVKNIVYAVYGMDIYANLIKDLNLHLKNMSFKEDSSPDSQINFIQFERKYRECVVEVNSLTASLDAYIKQRKYLLSNLNVLLRKLTEKTGVAFADIENIKDELFNLQNNKKQLDDEIKYINEEIIPLKLLHKNIKEALSILNAERPYMILNDIACLKNYFNEDASALKILEVLEKKINPEGNTKVKFNISDDELRRIQSIDKLLDSYDTKKLESFYSSKKTTFSLLKKKMDSATKLNDAESKDIMTSIEDVYNQLGETQFCIDTTTAVLKEKNSVLTFLKSEYESLKKQLLTQKKESNSYINVQLYKDAIEQFLEEKISEICANLSQSVFSELQRINFRNNSIGKVYISPKNFEVRLYEKNNKLIPSKLFSAGEKQILLGLVLKQSILASHIDTFFLFDTPVGRLDMNNRKLFTEEVIFKVSEQAIIFATDSDYSKKDYLAIKSNLTKEYKLTRNSKDQIVVVDGSIY